MKCRNLLDDVKTAVWSLLRDKLRRHLFTGGVASGMRGGLSLPTRRLGGTWRSLQVMLRKTYKCEPRKGSIDALEDGGSSCSSVEASVMDGSGAP